MIRKSERVLAAVIALLVLASVAAAVDISTPPVRPAAVVTLPDPASLVATLGDRLPPPPPPTTLPEPETTTTAPRVPTRASTPSARPIGSLASTAAAGIAPYGGLGTWVDVYDWTVTYTRESAPEVGPETVAAMADAGVQTIFIQASKHDAPTDVLEEDRLLAIVGAARARNLQVVAWYLPTLVDPAADLRRLLAIAALPFDGLGVDIEARQVSDVAERNRRLVDLSAALRSALPGRALAGIVLPPVIMEEVNPNYWPDFPWRAIAPYYDVWQTMGYWTDRKASSGWRDAYAYTMENVLRLRRNIGQPEAPVHPIGGIGHQTSEGDVAAFRRAASESLSIGGSLYDWRTTDANLWPALQAFRV